MGSFGGMHASYFHLFYMWWEALLLSIFFRFFPFPKWREVSAKGKVVIVTGADSGLGKGYATEMAKRGATVVMACRNMEKAAIARKSIISQTNCSSSSLDLFHLDLCDLSTVRTCAGQILEKYPKIHILMLNAGVSLNTKDRIYTKDGFEVHMAVNHLGHFLLTQLLLPALKKGEEEDARIITITSSALIQTNLDPEDLWIENGFRGFGYTMHYGNSKFASALISKEMAHRLSSEGSKVKTYALCPGFVTGTDILRDYLGQKFFRWLLDQLAMSLEKGVDRMLYLSIGKKVGFESGQIYRFNGKFSSAEGLMDDHLLSNKLWNKSLSLVGLR